MWLSQFLIKMYLSPEEGNYGGLAIEVPAAAGTFGY
jgi:hypothetical protein